MVQKGKFSAGAALLVNTLKNVDLPTLGTPTIPMRRLVPIRPIKGLRSGSSCFLGGILEVRCSSSRCSLTIWPLSTCKRRRERNDDIWRKPEEDKNHKNNNSAPSQGDRGSNNKTCRIEIHIFYGRHRCVYIFKQQQQWLLLMSVCRSVSPVCPWGPHQNITSISISTYRCGCPIVFLFSGSCNDFFMQIIS